MCSHFEFGVLVTVLLPPTEQATLIWPCSRAPTLHRFERLDKDPVGTEDKETDSQLDDSTAKADIWL